MLILRIITVIGYAAFWGYSITTKSPNVEWRLMFQIACLTLLAQSFIRLLESIGR